MDLRIVQLDREHALVHSARTFTTSFCHGEEQMGRVSARKQIF